MAGISPDSWADLHRWLDEAADLPTEDRQAFVDRVCAGDEALKRELWSMLEALDETEEYFFDRPVLSPDSEERSAENRFFEERSSEERLRPTAAARPPGRVPEETVPFSSEVPTEAGPYRVSRRLGAGGMGEVYLAHRADDTYQKKVAVKILRPEASSGDMVHRFRHERQILAGLDHPGIARLLDGGTLEDGRPFLAMEFVEGCNIDRYCEIHELGVEARLELFRKVCEAVHFAHQRLVVHRDLKPSNILITDDGEPKLLDFGIAKLLDPAALDLDMSYQAPVTSAGLRPMTLAYAAPEQILGRGLSTACDVYSLGVLLYELLSGRRPYKIDPMDPMGSLKAICEDQPRRPSTVVWDPDRFDQGKIGAPPDIDGKRLRRRLSGDLDRIVLKALAKDPGERYSSVEQLGTDLLHHQLGLPVSARPHTFTYRTAKFIRRHRWSVAASATFLVVLLGLLVALLFEREESRVQQATAEKVKSFLISLFSQSDPDESRGRTITVEEVLEEGLLRLDEELAGDEALRGPLLDTMGVSFMRLGRLETAEDLLRQAVEAHRIWEGEHSLEVARSLYQLAELEDWQGRYQESERSASIALGIFAERLGPTDPETVIAFVRRGRSRHLLGRFEEALDDFSSALTRLELGRGDDETRLEVLQLYSFLLSDMDRLAEAEAMMAEALDLSRRTLELPHRRVARILNGYGLLLERLGRYEQAEARLHEAEAMQAQLFKGPHAEIATTWHNLANLYARGARSEEATALFEKSLAMRREVLGPDHPAVAESLGSLARVYQDLSEADRAESLLAESVAILEGRFGTAHDTTARAYRRLAQLKVDRGKYAEAQELFEQVLDVQQQIFGNTHTEVGVTLNNLGEAVFRQGDLEQAADLFGRAVQILLVQLGREHGTTASALLNFATVRHYQERYDEADAGYAEALAAARLALAADDHKIAQILVSFASLRRTREDLDASVSMAEEAWRILETKDGLGFWKDRALRTWARSASGLGRHDEAVEACRRRVELGFAPQRAEEALAAAQAARDAAAAG